MSKFTKVYKKWNDGNNGKNYSAREFHKALMHKFGDWQPPKPLVVVPQRFADWIESQTDREKESYWYIFDKFVNDSRRKKLGIDFFGVGDLSLYPQGWDKVLLSALIDGYTVEKEKKYILKHIDLSEQDNVVSLYLSHGLYEKLQHERYSKDVDMSEIKQCHFTQSEIDKLNIGSYEQIEV